MGQHTYFLLALVALINGIGFITANRYCFDFTYNPFTSSYANQTWENTQSIDWKWSGSGVPDTDNIPNFEPPGTKTAPRGYIWLQDYVGSPNTATFRTVLENYIINPGEVVSIEIYRHINYDDGTYRPVLNFHQLGGSSGYEHQVLWSFNQNVWDMVGIACGPEAAPCCLTYPCQGYFDIDGSILARDELLAIGGVAVDGDLIGCPIFYLPTSK